MRIIDDAKRPQTALNSANAVWYDYDTFTRAFTAYPSPVRQSEDTLLYAVPIPGGYALWQEDIAIINRLHKETENSINKLRTANAILAEEGKTMQAMQEESEKTRLMASLGDEISGFTIRLQTMVEQLENTMDKKKATGRIILLLCYIKRRCNLFFREKESDFLPADELTMYLNELAEMAGYADIKIIFTNELYTPLSVRQATIFYDFYYNTLYWASWVDGIHIIAHFGIEGGHTVLRLLSSEDAENFRLSKTVISAAESVGGIYTVKDLDDGFGLSLSFPKGGAGNG